MSVQFKNAIVPYGYDHAERFDNDSDKSSLLVGMSNVPSGEHYSISKYYPDRFDCCITVSRTDAINIVKVLNKLLTLNNYNTQ